MLSKFFHENNMCARAYKSLYDRIKSLKEEGKELDARNIVVRFLTPEQFEDLKKVTNTHKGRLNEPHELNSIVSISFQTISLQYVLFDRRNLDFSIILPGITVYPYNETKDGKAPEPMPAWHPMVFPLCYPLIFYTGKPFFKKKELGDGKSKSDDEVRYNSLTVQIFRMNALNFSLRRKLSSNLKIMTTRMRKKMTRRSLLKETEITDLSTTLLYEFPNVQ